MAIPPDIRIRLEQLRGEMAAKAEAQRRQQQAQANAEKMSKQFVPGKAGGGSMPSTAVMRLAVGGQGPRNWLKGSIEPVIDQLKVPNNPPEHVAHLQRELEEAQSMGDQGYINAVQNDMRSHQQRTAINNWITSNLANYVRKHMATHDDPVRKLAEQGITHLPEGQMHPAGYQQFAEANRKDFNAPRLGKSPEAQRWEDVADSILMQSTVDQVKKSFPDKYEPWMDKASPDTTVFRPVAMHADYTGFDHIVDVLKQDLAEGRIRPEQLNKVSIEQAVRRVHEYDQERKKAMAETALKATEGMPVHKDYGDGFKWIELTLPKDLPEGWTAKSLPSGGETYYDPQGERHVHPNMGRLKDALQYEGDTMGHCVGGYCPDVAEGRSRIFSLRDKNNEPHVTIEVKPEKNPYLNSSGNISDTGLQKIRQKFPQSDFDLEYGNWFKSTGQHSMHFAQKYAPWIKENYPEIYEATIGAPMGHSIKQIKGKGNAKPKANYIPYVQDFVKSGQWEKVDDLHNTDLRDIHKTPALRGWLADNGIQTDRYVTEDEYAKHEGNMLLDKLGVQGKAKGGEVKQPSLDTMRLALNKQGMYSPLEKAAMSIPRTKGTPAEFMAEISKQPGFRKDEVEDRKISLPEQKMTKQEFLEHVQKNHPAPRLDEKIYRDESEDEDGDSEGRTQYEQYQLPGGQNYREVLLKTPTFSPAKDHQIMELESNIRRMNPDDYPPGYVQNMVDAVNKLKAEKAAMGTPYQSSHWQDDPNVLAHMRLSDRYVGDTGNFAVMGTKGGKTRWLFTTGINGTPEQAQQAAKKWEDQGYTTSINQVGGGKKLLHIEEIQSDWHQQGRKDGYNDGQATNAYNDEIRRLAEKYGVPLDSPNLPSKVRPFMNVEEFDKMLDMEKASRTGVPDAPFKKNWHELALKHALNIAAKGGYDGIVITPGQQQAERYDLSQHIDELHYNPDLGTLVGNKDRQGKLYERNVTPDKLESYVGKEVAAKIMAQEPNEGGMRSLVGQQLTVGGEGMKGFYDKIVPTYLNKLGKPHGAQVGKIAISAPSEKSWGIEDAAKFHGMTGAEYLDHPDRPQLEKQFLQARQNQKADLHYFPITDSMRQQIKNEGLPQYEQGGKVKGLDHFFESDNSLDHFFQE